MSRAQVLLMFTLACIVSSMNAQDTNHTLVAVFAHPDDEFMVSPLLARYARQGARVRLIIATKSERYAPQTHLSPGPAIADLRASEAKCAARALGILEPTILSFGAGSLGERTQPPWLILSRLETNLRAIFSDLKPSVVLTFGPEGMYGHPDHRLVGAVVTQIVQSGGSAAPRLLLYAGIPQGRIPEIPGGPQLPFSPVAPEYLPIRIAYTDDDLRAAAASFACYRSQFADTLLTVVPQEFHRDVWKGYVYLRSWTGSLAGDDLFALRPPR